MAGTSIPLISKRAYNFDNGDSTIIVAKAVSCVNWTSGTLLVRVHAASIDGSGSIKVIAYTTAPSAEDPSTDFVYGTAVATATVPSGAAAGELYTATLSSDFGAFLQIVVDGTAGTTTSDATISAELVLKD